MKLPGILIPHIPVDPKIGSPCWFTSPPRIKMLRCGGCIPLDDVKFRDRKGRYWTVPRGMPNDGMSYPWPQCSWLPDRYDARTRREGILHDCSFALNDYFSEWHNLVKLFDVNVNLLDGLKMSRPDLAHAFYTVVKLAGYSVWAHKSREKLMLQWLEFVDKPEQLDEWIKGVVAAYGIPQKS